jgi:hypothetical protein
VIPVSLSADAAKEPSPAERFVRRLLARGLAAKAASTSFSSTIQLSCGEWKTQRDGKNSSTTRQ